MPSAEISKSVEVVGWAEEQGRRDEMEDGFVFVDCFGDDVQSAYLAVYDGHGGRETVDFLAANLHEKLLAEMRKAKEVSVPDALTAAFKDADETLRDQLKVNQSGATACVVFQTREGGRASGGGGTSSEEGRVGGHRVLYCAHVGDTRAVLCHGGVAVRLTCRSDHKASDLLEARRVTERGGKVVNERVEGMLAITRAFGDAQLKTPNTSGDFVSNEPSIKRWELGETDAFVIIACDGLWDVMSDETAVDLVLSAVEQLSISLAVKIDGRDVADIACRMLVEEALARGTTDNVTVLIAFFNGQSSASASGSMPEHAMDRDGEEARLAPHPHQGAGRGGNATATGPLGGPVKETAVPGVERGKEGA
uniref:PPM-type phosphatase domain-containing protein n=1 Tax=Chromera velia CCMP2878 TaxID=1169474 RepID=A0A0G4HYD0_9ALVE|eukprot:Cvel_9463.t1-p1 / transcript=Cvel_9463.t1 / gene=Cvel_9463 / organism=Chromera_velia_CCMP2878 / gene_product=Protein phosphatase 2C homolog 1, putative / transcript_product=Protein phosphatase 2C homolog 1, putative / location=Cvel_scaffold546:20393-26651(-) / protein_length=364 / sequence_SO=supercontig / SO=protein_coding / is_pseudo=false